LRFVDSDIYDAGTDNASSYFGKLVIEGSRLWGANQKGWDEGANIFVKSPGFEEGYTAITIVKKSFVGGVPDGGYNMYLKGGKHYFEDVSFGDNPVFRLYKETNRYNSNVWGPDGLTNCDPTCNFPFPKDSILMINGVEYEPDVEHTKLK